MARQHIEILFNTGYSIEDVPDPETGEIVGRKLHFIDKDDGSIIQYPMTIDIAKKLGQALMGIGQVIRADGTDLANLDKIKPRGKG